MLNPYTLQSETQTMWRSWIRIFRWEDHLNRGSIISMQISVSRMIVMSSLNLIFEVVLVMNLWQIETKMKMYLIHDEKALNTATSMLELCKKLVLIKSMILLILIIQIVKRKFFICLPKLNNSNCIGINFRGDHIDKSKKRLYIFEVKDVTSHWVISLDLRINKLSTMPNLKTELFKYMKKLRLDNNQFTAFPESIFWLKLLETLTMTNNSLSWIPNGIKSLCRLETFHISKNPIKYISAEIKYLTRLKDIWVDWISYINFNSLKDTSRAEEEQDPELWKVIKQILFFKIDEIISNRPSLARASESYERWHVDFENREYSSLAYSSNHQENSLSFIDFLNEAIKIIHKNPELDIKHADVFINDGYLMHMAVELCHIEYVKYFSFSHIPINEVNGMYKTPFHVAIDKKSKHMKLRILKVLKSNRLSPFLSFTVKDSPLKMWLKQQDLDSSFELIQNDNFVNEFIEELTRDEKSDEYVTQLLIDWFKLFNEGYK